MTNASMIDIPTRSPSCPTAPELGPASPAPALGVDVAVVGGGLVGAATALALERIGLDVALLEARDPPAGPWPEEDWDSRVYAINAAAASHLNQLGAWQRLPAGRLQAVAAMDIRGDLRMASLRFTAWEAGVRQLAWILESRQLAAALWAGLRQGTVRLIDGRRPVALSVQADRARLQLDDGSEITARLVVGADGRDSWVRQAAGLHREPVPYGQSGVVANFACEGDHGGVARQWFMPEGILAWLPLPGRRMSMVWSLREDRVEELMNAGHAALCARVAAGGGHGLGRLRLITPPAAFPLRRLTLPAITASRVVLVGDAAHNVHPLAGQGVNLGFGDVRDLARALAGRPPGGDPGMPQLLARYQRARREEILLMQGVTAGLASLFCNRNPLLGLLRNAGLAATGQLGPLRRSLIRHALGETSAEGGPA